MTDEYRKSALKSILDILNITEEFVKAYMKINHEIDLLGVSWDSHNEIPCAQVKGIFNIAALTYSEPFSYDNKTCVDFGGVRLFEYEPNIEQQIKHGYWIPCNKELPKGLEDEIACLVTCQEWDIFNNKWGSKEIRILSYSTIARQWNTKSDVRVIAWARLPTPYE
jgi:hypothetical protein